MELGSGVGMLGVTLLKAVDVASYTFTDCNHKVLAFLIYNLGLNFPLEPPPGGQLNESQRAEREASRRRHLDEGPPPCPAAVTSGNAVYSHSLGGDGGGDSNNNKNDGRAVAQVGRLDWQEGGPPANLAPPDGPDDDGPDGFDVVLGTDIVYERSLIAPLCRMVRNLLLKARSPAAPGAAVPEQPQQRPRRPRRQGSQQEPAEGAVAFIACTQRSMTTSQQFESELSKHDLTFAVIHQGAFSPSENLLCSDVEHQLTKIYEIKAN